MTIVDSSEPPLNTQLSVFERASKAFIQYPRLRSLHQAIQRCHVLTKKLHEPQCMVLEGHPGVGKTTITKMYASAFPRDDSGITTHIPVFYFLTPSPVTVKGLAISMLQALGDPLSGRGTLASLNARLVHYLKVCHVELVILDDFHHLIDIDTDTILRTVSDWLKVLLRMSGVPILVVGVEGKVQRILRANQQLSRHFCTAETLLPFQWDTDESMKEFAAFIAYTEQAIGMTIQMELSRAEILRRIHYATAGVVGNIMNLFRYAAIQAEEMNRTYLLLADLAWAYDTRLLEHMKPRINPFGTNLGGIFVAPDVPPLPDPTSIRKRRARKKQGEELPSVTDILKT